jgi:hypothetical protein
MKPYFDLVREADADLLVELARAFHDEEGHPLTVAGQAALRQLAQGRSLAPSLSGRAGRHWGTSSSLSGSASNMAVATASLTISISCPPRVVAGLAASCSTSP